MKRLWAGQASAVLVPLPLQRRYLLSSQNSWLWPVSCRMGTAGGEWSFAPYYPRRISSAAVVIILHAGLFLRGSTGQIGKEQKSMQAQTLKTTLMQQSRVQEVCCDVCHLIQSYRGKSHLRCVHCGSPIGPTKVKTFQKSRQQFLRRCT